MTVSSDEMALLRVLATADGPAGMFDVTIAINPEPQKQVARQAWMGRQLELIDTFLDLYRRGWICEVVTGGGHTGDRYTLTEQGRTITRRA